MKTRGCPVLAAKAAAIVALAAGIGAVAPASAQLAVIDIATVKQTTVSALENVAQTAKQIQQYQTQLQQYENMLRNTAAPAAHIWDQAQTTMNALRGSIDTLNYYKGSLGSVDAYLRQFKDASGYRASPCFSVNGCTQVQWDAMMASERLGSEAQKRANDALFRGLDQQQEAMVVDARQLERLQSSAQGATGQVQAIGYANQLASHQSNQLLQIRALLIAQQSEIATRNQVMADREAKEAAAAESIRRGTFTRTPVTRAF
ncbi:P-type conjugative transfer protein TrbJ [Massilia psychrophila]|uniref:P-type conjugative transfer protein TrbJ n=1 Tax=Massilia psychrophila TaxID=1603353 RepID=A0A2G8SYN5_9BURK|nr:P-type conjugative transfer protein TrbJ [Massilia psychrophila]PIL38871.1 P-type conjugative transfer protein TrbJ [Massilia psychrophila]GGE90349.1 conjugal transfer protein TrbJ [Massilia psychrophila]